MNKGAFLFPFRLAWWTITFQLRRRLQLRRDCRLIAESGLFDPLFYLRQNNDVALARIDPLLHYATVGGRENRDPHPLFDTPWYLEQNPDLTAPQANPLLHYLTKGWPKGASPHPLFDASFYLKRNPDVAQAGTEPLRHYLTVGGREGRDPHPLFDSGWYLGQNPDVGLSGANPLLHYLQQGWRERRDPHPLFDSGFYRHHNPDVAASRANPLLHYLQQGWKLGSNPHPLFNIGFYFQQRPDLPPGSTDPLRHYICQGANEGLDPCELFDSSFYLERYPRVAQAGLNPLAHFWIHGTAEYCNPHPLFDTRFYLTQYPAVAAAGTNPLLDFMASGAWQGRQPNLFFDPTFYLRNNADVRGSGLNPLVHYLKIGAKEGRDPGPFFGTTRYFSQHPQLKDSDMNPLVHFLESSQRTSKAPATDRALMQVLGATELRSVTSVTQANEVLRSAAQTNSHLLVFLDALALEKENIELLLKAFDLDPHFGIAIPRQSHHTTGEILKLIPESGDLQLSTLPPQILPKLPGHYILPEVLTSCFVLRNSVISNFDLLDETYETLHGAFQHYFWRVRRCGFRSVVVNDVLAGGKSGKNSWFAPVSGRDLFRLHTEHPDFGRAQMEFLNHPLHRHESLLARALSRVKPLRQTLLIDTRGLPTQVNGTVEAVLGVCDGLRQLDSDWGVTLLASPEPAEFHGLRRRYPNWKIIDEEADRYFTAALRPSQPWNIASMAELHNRALFNFYTILDTISWDILFVAPPRLSVAWNFLSQYADGLVYISQYTKDRFSVRFPSSRDTPGYVSHLSFNPDDYRDIAVETNMAYQSDFLLVAGNAYDHKNVRPTVDLLAPLSCLKIKALGLKTHSNSHVECLESGRIPQADLERLFAKAAIIVFPSFYEGFGLPVLKGLSYGRTVIARHSELLLEIASHYRGPGRLISFRNSQELTDAVQRVIRGSEIAEVPLGSALGNAAKPRGWKEVAAGILQFIEEQTQDVSRSRWLTRQGAIEQLDA